MKDGNGNEVPGAHPNSRFTAPISQCPTASFRLEQHHGVPIFAIIFGGRRAHVAPLVYQAFDWEHGVYVGATTASERTAAQFGKIGEVRRDPMAMLPFCGYNMADYFRHWLFMGLRMKKQPKVFHVNWFRTNEEGKFLWPGYRESLRVIEWILARWRGEAQAMKSPIGYIPTPESLDLAGLDLCSEDMNGLLNIDREAWLEELDGHKEFFVQFGKRLPVELWQQYQRMCRRFGLDDEIPVS